MMRVSQPTALAIITVLVLGATPWSANAAIKCWTNHDGVRECGNVVPPEFAQQGHETLNERGMTKSTVEAAKTREELAAERAAEEAARQVRMEQQERDRADRVLLDTFASVDDLILTRDGQIAHLESQIRLVRGHIDKLRENLDKMIERAADVERRGSKPSEDMINNIDSVRAQIDDNEEFISSKQREQHEIRERFDADIARFRTLKGLNEMSEDPAPGPCQTQEVAANRPARKNCH